MINCDVGFKCRDCTNRTTAHTHKINWKHFVTGCFLGLVSGVIFGFAGSMIDVGYTFLNLILIFILGQFFAGVIHKCVQYKISKKLIWCIMFATIAGLLCTPFAGNILGLLLGDAEYRSYYLYQLLNGSVFIFGIRQGFTNRFFNW